MGRLGENQTSFALGNNMEKVMRSLNYKDFYITPKPEFRGSQFYDTYTVSAYPTGVNNQQLRTVHEVNLMSLHSVQGFPEEQLARESAIAKGKAWVDSHRR